MNAELELIPATGELYMVALQGKDHLMLCLGENVWHGITNLGLRFAARGIDPASVRVLTEAERAIVESAIGLMR